MNQFSGNIEELKRRITKEAESKREKIAKEAEKLYEAEKKAIEEESAKQEERIHRLGESTKEQIIHSYQRQAEANSMRAALCEREKTINTIMERCSNFLQKRLKEEGSETILEKWIEEGAIALSVESLSVNSSPLGRKRLTEPFLKKSTQKIKERYGVEVELIKASDSPLMEEGIILSSLDGKRVYDNRVSARVLRFQREIRKIISQILATL